jgi:hypothetical protein
MKACLAGKNSQVNLLKQFSSQTIISTSLFIFHHPLKGA